MRITGKTAFVIIAVSLAGFAAFGFSMRARYKSRGELAERVFSLGGSGGETTPQTVEGLRAAIAAYEKRIEQHVRDAAKTASYWKILAVRLQDRGLHGEALEALEQALAYTPSDPSLHYSAGVSAGIMAKSLHLFPGREPGERERCFSLAEESFLRAIELDSRYLRPRYSLGVLYVFDLDRPEEAIPHLEYYLEISRNDTDAMFVLARAFFALERFEEAVNLYDRIIAATKDEQKRTDAQNNRQLALGRLYG